jgi:acetylglutamate kinase
VAQLQAHNSNAMGFSGADGNLIQSEKNHPTINYGFVGDVKYVNALLLETCFITELRLYFAPSHTIKRPTINQRGYHCQ